VGFTTISSQISAAKVSDMLDRLYGRFDALSFKHDVFKIETVGDAYLCVTNLVAQQEKDHVKRIAEFSVGAIQAARETLIDLDNPAMGYIQIRVGFHSGPVIASVVGSRLPKFSMFGDTINFASRMESNSKAGRIHCSKEAAELLIEQCPEMLLISRGEIEIKGKGLMETFWVEPGPDFQLERAAMHVGSLGTVDILSYRYE
jgi:class 3 adenylate cyclase